MGFKSSDAKSPKNCEPFKIYFLGLNSFFLQKHFELAPKKIIITTNYLFVAFEMFFIELRPFPFYILQLRPVHSSNSVSVHMKRSIHWLTHEMLFGVVHFKCTTPRIYTEQRRTRKRHRFQTGP